MTKEFSPGRLDVKAFAEEGAQLRGAEPLAKFKRLLDETQGRGAETDVVWSAHGELRNAGHVNPDIWLHLHADTVLALTCQRCLLPVDMPVSVERSFRFAPDEEAAAAEDEEAEEDVLALTRSLDLHGLIEDELIMDMPVAPRHEVCPEPVAMEAVDEEFTAAEPERANPFAVLGKLKGGKS